jgi:imidazolonepropionase-like amidohydrolase
VIRTQGQLSIVSLSLLCALCALSILTINVRAQERSVARSVLQQSSTTTNAAYLIRNARIFTLAGPVIENGAILIRGGKIEAVGTTISAAAGAQEIDGTGLNVYPGMIDAGTSLGLSEIELGANGGVDTTEVGELNPNASAFNAINPHSAHINVTRVNGITSAVTLPLGGLISGQAALINLDGSTVPEMAVLPRAALVINFPRAATDDGGGGFFAPPTEVPITEAITTRDKQVERLRKMLRDAEAYARAQDAYERDKSLPRPNQSVVLAALVPYVRGERPVIFRADRESEIRAAIRFADEMRLRAIILGGSEAWKAAALLKERNVPVIVTSVRNLPPLEDDYYDVLYANPAKLKEAGVRFCISSGDAGPEVRDLPYHAGMAASFGLAREEALKAVTIYPAQIMGVSDRLGTIEVGKVANLSIADGDLLDARTHIRYLFINGRQLPLTSRHTELYEQFKDRK